MGDVYDLEIPLNGPTGDALSHDLHRFSGVLSAVGLALEVAERHPCIDTRRLLLTKVWEGIVEARDAAIDVARRWEAHRATLSAMSTGAQRRLEGGFQAALEKQRALLASHEKRYVACSAALVDA